MKELIRAFKSLSETVVNSGQRAIRLRISLRPRLPSGFERHDMIGGRRTFIQDMFTLVM